MAEHRIIRAANRTEPPTTRSAGHTGPARGLIVPAEATVRAAYDELAEHYVDAATAREMLTDLVAKIGAQRERQEHHDAIRATKTAPSGPTPTDPTELSRAEWAAVDRLLRLGIAVINGNRGLLRDIEDRKITTVPGRAGVNYTANVVGKNRRKTAVMIRKVHPTVLRDGDRATFYISARVEWDNQTRALSATVARDSRGFYRLTRFAIL